MALRCAALFLLIVVAFLPVQAQEKKALAELKGTWKLVAYEVDGKSRDAEDEFPRWVIKADTIRYGGEDWANLTLDAAATPKGLDLKMVGAKKTYEAIYKVEGNTLKICVNRLTDGVKDRPGDFTTLGNENRRLLIFERDKDGTGDGPQGAGFVGIAIQAKDDPKAIVVLAAVEGSPAKKAGLKADDVVLKVGTEDAKDLQQVVALVRAAKAGSSITFRIRRDNKEQDITVKAGVIPFFPLD